MNSKSVDRVVLDLTSEESEVFYDTPLNPARQDRKTVVGQKQTPEQPKPKEPRTPRPRTSNRQILSSIAETQNVQAGTKNEIHRVQDTQLLSSKAVNFFSSDVFQIVLRNPTTAHRLREFARANLCEENLDFLDHVSRYHHSLDLIAEEVLAIHGNFISANAKSQINVTDQILGRLNGNIKQIFAQMIPEMEKTFTPAQQEVEKLIEMDIYPRFIRHQLTLSASKALATNKNQYSGLGDCFVLTDPRKADNPIVYASDGFVQVTGYSRREIIPRNCRFLQNHQTDLQSVTRIRNSIHDPAEHLELLLNQRKTGEPFWNLLYTCPLYSEGRLTFFLGGQINVSSTVHSTSDVLSILAEGQEESVQPSSRNSTKRERSSLFSSMRRPPRIADTPDAPGMEQQLLKTLDRMQLNEQKYAFYSAYSKYIIVEAEKRIITFCSKGVLDMLVFGEVKPATATIGQDIFKYLSHHASGTMLKDFKARAKVSIKHGQATSLDISLRTLRANRLETFSSHWTPLKDEKHMVGFVVVTFGSVRDREKP